jgi:hypothetical protein
MSINVYLRGEEVRKLADFKVCPRTEKGQSWEEYKLPGIDYLRRDKGRWLLNLSDPTDPVPAIIADIVDEISLYENFAQVSARETGVYRYRSAEGTLEVNQHDRKAGYQVKILGKKMEDIRTLLRLIKTGAIRPEESYEGPQSGRPKRDLELQLAHVTELLTKAQDELRSANRKVELAQHVLGRISNFVNKEIAGSRQFLFRGAYIVRRINRILNCDAREYANKSRDVIADE